MQPVTGLVRTDVVALATHETLYEVSDRSRLANQGRSGTGIL